MIRYLDSSILVASLLPSAVEQAEARKYGVRGGAIYDYMHLVSARKVCAEVVYTLNFNDFQNIVREAIRESRFPSQLFPTISLEAPPHSQ
jgi:hypothetical protein